VLCFRVCYFDSPFDVIIVFYICRFDDATDMRYRGVRRQGTRICLFIIATVCLVLSWMTEQVGRYVMATMCDDYFLCVCRFIIDWTAKGCFFDFDFVILFSLVYISWCLDL
jgi:hypothetical protein